MHNKKRLKTYLTIILLAFGLQNAHGQTFCTTNSDQIAGTQDGFRYELWNQNAQGTACMTLGEGALFSGEWSGILNYLARRGLGYNQTQEHQEIGKFIATYDCDYNPTIESGNSYLSIYGWTVDPLIEFYIVEDWRNWIPSMANGSTNHGTFDVNGGTYDIIENTRTNQPSIVGTATFQQYFSIRRDERNSGTINISDHFEKWESLGLDLGKLHEVSFVVEGYQSNGDFAFNELDIYLGDDTEAPLGVEGFESLFTIYPNPNDGDITLKFNEPAVEASAMIYDPTGKLVFSQKNIQTSTIQISSLEKGIYLVEVINDGLKYNTKLLVE